MLRLVAFLAVSFETAVSAKVCTDEQKGWALGACAVLTQANKDFHHLLGGKEKSEQGVTSAKRILLKWWDVESRDDLLKMLESMETVGGHRRSFDSYSKLTEEQRQASFISWEDLGENYLIGRKFWSLAMTEENGKKYVAAVE